MEFNELAELEPKLRKLYDDAMSIDNDSPDFCSHLVWFSNLKPQLVRIVGRLAKNSILQSSEAYDLSYRTIYNVMPHCKHSGDCRYY